MADDVQRITGTTAKSAARLCNIPTSTARLLPAHLKYLDEIVKTLSAMQGPWVDLIGYASRSGDPNYNMLLSGQRIDAVKKYLSSRVRGINFQQQRRMGESESGPNERDNSGYWRAVEIFVYGTKPQAPTRPPDPVSTEFEIRVVGGGSASIVAAQADFLWFQIVDTIKRKTAFYQYTGGGAALSLPKIPGPGSVTKVGPPTRFKTGRPAELHMFNSKADLAQDPGATIGTIGWGKMRLTLNSVWSHDGPVTVIPSTLVIEGGAGIQMPGLGSITRGVLAKVTHDWPFTGY